MATILHDSDCATHNEPAHPNGPCNCGATQLQTGVHPAALAAVREAGRMSGCAEAQRDKLKALIEAAYREGVSHGESNAAAYEWGAVGDASNTWERSDSKEKLDEIKS